MRRLTALLALGMILTACAFGGEDAAVLSDDPAPTAAGDSDREGGDAAAPEAPGEVQIGLDGIDDRKVIRSARLQLHASDTRAAYEEIVRLAESVGGFVASANVFPFHGEEDVQPEVALTLRIPADQLTATMEAIKESVDEVVSESQNAEDVTDQFVDLEARLRNLEALEVELRALLQEVRAQPDADPQKLLTVFNELSSVRGQIEQAQGRLNLLEDMTTLATVEIHISQTPKAAPIVEHAWEPMVAAREALTDLVSSLQTVADWTINFALFVLPMLLLTVALPVTVAYLVLRRFFPRRGRASTSEATPAES